MYLLNFMKLEREFSQELASDLRQETADKIKAIRNKPDNFSDNGELKENYDDLKKNIWGKIFKTEKYREQEAILDNLVKQKKELDIKTVQSEYQEKFNQLLNNCPLTSKERAKYLSTEAMEQMPLEDYLILLKRLSGEAFYHVTRYGARENTFMSTGGGHTQGEGEFVDGFTPLLKDGHINSCTATVIADKERARSLISSEFLKAAKEKGSPVAEVVEEILSSYGNSQAFLDRESTHFSYGKELHKMYGSEDAYKLYFYYPVEYILQNDFFHSTRESQLNIGNGYYNNDQGIKQQYNDFEIFNFGEGVSINAGILCITGDAPVDPETGSKYLFKDGKPVHNEKGEFTKPAKTVSSKEYWENYFKLHPELKPSKIIYGDYYSSTYKQNQDLQNWAQTKEIHRQDENKNQEFIDYRRDTKEQLRKIFTDIVQEEFNS